MHLWDQGRCEGICHPRTVVILYHSVWEKIYSTYCSICKMEFIFFRIPFKFIAIFSYGPQYWKMYHLFFSNDYTVHTCIVVDFTQLSKHTHPFVHLYAICILMDRHWYYLKFMLWLLCISTCAAHILWYLQSITVLKSVFIIIHQLSPTGYFCPNFCGDQ